MSITLDRELKLLILLNKKSHFLFGPRSTGKTFLIRTQLATHATIIDLLRVPILTRLLTNPGELENLIDASPPKKGLVVIDEIQKIPSLLDEVHRLIEERKMEIFTLRE